MPTPQRRWKFALLALAGLLAAGVVAALLVRDRMRIVVLYHDWRLEGAETPEEEATWTQAILADLATPEGQDIILGLCSPDRPRMTHAVFLHISDSPPESLIQTFAARLLADERLLAAWSHHVRWRCGWGILERLDRLSPHVEAPPGRSFPCIPSERVHLVHHDHPNAELIPSQGVRDLETAGIAWFIGMSPTTTKWRELSAWLRAAAPFQRATVFDEKLGRCLRPGEPGWVNHPETLPFSGRGLPIPDEPLPGWEGPVPGEPRTGILPVFPLFEDQEP